MKDSLIECLAVVLSGPLGLFAVFTGIAGGGWIMSLLGASLFAWSMYMWHKAIAGYYR